MGKREFPSRERNSLKPDSQDNSIVAEVLDYFLHVEKKSLQMVQGGQLSQKEFLKRTADYLKTKRLQGEELQEGLEQVRKYVFGYYVLEDLLADEQISDIRVLGPDNVRVKRLGKRMNSDVKFRDREDYRRFVELAATKNKVSLSVLNAVQTFTDKTGNDQFILRFDISTELVNSVDLPYLSIRKIPKQKKRLSKLVEEGMLTDTEAGYLAERAAIGQGLLVAGKGGSGKTTLLNALLEQIPNDQSGLVIQENEELFSDHPELMFQHIVDIRGEGKVQYSLRDLARNGLLMDLDYYIIGEIKGEEALYLLTASYTGHKCWTSIHANSAEQAADKLADYIKYESDYSKREALQMLTGLETIIFMKGYRIEEIVEIEGWDDVAGNLRYKQIFGEV
ncbi:ATPase, T2SS/T4P/T4SS family [Diplocloster hominis]|uniref:ATPase, T2SS/T4P/T4SS family n=1 Tax=Diplocloster hominis TaxID=3079010 RepID=UPI0031BB5DC6